MSLLLRIFFLIFQASFSITGFEFKSVSFIFDGFVILNFFLESVTLREDSFNPLTVKWEAVICKFVDIVEALLKAFTFKSLFKICIIIDKEAFNRLILRIFQYFPQLNIKSLLFRISWNALNRSIHNSLFIFAPMRENKGQILIEVAPEYLSE